MIYRPKRDWAWDEKAEAEYHIKRERLAAQGYVTDEDVVRYFAEKGVPDIRPQDVRAIMLDSICSTPFELVMRELS